MQMKASPVTQSKESTEEVDSIPGPGGSPGEENGNPVQYCCLRNPMDRGAWWSGLLKDMDFFVSL